MDEPGYILCYSVLSKPVPPLPLNLVSKDTCTNCGCEIWISNASRKMMEEKNLKAQCLECGKNMAQDEPDTKIQMPSKEQLAEIEEANR